MKTLRHGLCKRCHAKPALRDTNGLCGPCRMKTNSRREIASCEISIRYHRSELSRLAAEFPDPPGTTEVEEWTPLTGWLVHLHP